MSASAYVEAYLRERRGAEPDLDRLVSTPSGLDAAGILEAIADPRLGRQALEVMADLMHPTDSMYYDAIYGAFHGQQDIRRWLIPTMAEIEFIEFVPQNPTALFDDGAGGTSLDEWQMVAVLGEERMPLSKGVSVRRYLDGWITWNADVYDTGAFRTPPEPGAEAPDLPPWPRTEWDSQADSEPQPLSAAAQRWLEQRGGGNGSAGTTEPSGLSHRDLHEISHHPELGYDFDLFADLMHPTDSIYIDPLFGEFRGRAAIRAWLDDIMGKVGSIRFDHIGPVLFNGDASVEEWVQVAVLPDRSRVPMMRGTSVRRFADGWITYAADYFDTAPLFDPDIVAAGVAAGSTVTAADILRYRPVS